MADYGFTTVTPPASEPVSATNAKLHARIDGTVEDAIVNKWISAARELAEDHTGKAWVNQTLSMTLLDWPYEHTDRWPMTATHRRVVRLPREPVSAVNHVKYYTVLGVLTTLTEGVDYQTDLTHSPPLIAPYPAKVWPTVQPERLKAIEVEFVAGYGASSGWPARAEEAIFLTLTYWNRNRGDGRDPTMLGLPDGAIRLLDSLWAGSY